MYESVMLPHLAELGPWLSELGEVRNIHNVCKLEGIYGGFINASTLN